MAFQNAPTLDNTVSASFSRLRFRWEVGMGWVGIYFGLGWDSQLESSLEDTLIFCIILCSRLPFRRHSLLKKRKPPNQTKYLKGLKVKITFPFKLKFQIWYRKLSGKYTPLGCPDILSLLFKWFASRASSHYATLEVTHAHFKTFPLAFLRPAASRHCEKKTQIFSFNEGPE